MTAQYHPDLKAVRAKHLQQLFLICKRRNAGFPPQRMVHAQNNIPCIIQSILQPQDLPIRDVSIFHPEHRIIDADEGKAPDLLPPMPGRIRLRLPQPSLPEAVNTIMIAQHR